MKLRSTTKWPLLALSLVAVAALVLVSWDQKQKTPTHKQIDNDTIPQKKVRDLDDVIAEMERADIEKSIEKAMKEAQEAMKNFDGEKIRMQIEMAMKEVDMAKIQKEINEAMAKVDMKKMQLEIDKAMKEVDMKKIQEEIKESMEKVDWEKMKKELEEIKLENNEEFKAEMEKVKKEMEKMKPQLEKEMAKVKVELEKAKVEIEKAKAEMKEYKTFVDGLENDGLINKKENYTIEHKDGKLTVNGKTVTDKTYNKYKSFLEKHKEFSIKKSEDDFDIDVD